MAIIGKPPRKGTKGTPPKMEETKENLKKPASNEKVQVHISATPEWKKEIQLFAIENGMNVTQVIKAAFEEYKNKTHS